MGLREDEMLERMTLLLEQGCTMLATHHGCGAPLFRCKGKVVCPVCSYEGKANSRSLEPLEGARVEEVDQRKGAAEKEATTVGREEGVTCPEDEEMRRRRRELEKDLEISLIGRLRELKQRVEHEQDPENLRMLLECTNSLLRVLRSLERAD
jgi:UPF0148 protein